MLTVTPGISIASGLTVQQVIRSAGVSQEAFREMGLPPLPSRSSEIASLVTNDIGNLPNGDRLAQFAVNTSPEDFAVLEKKVRANLGGVAADAINALRELA